MSPTRGLPGEDPERSSIQFGNTTIPFSIRRSPRRITVSITVHPGIGVVVTAPENAGNERLDAIIRAKGAWIVGKLRRDGRVETALPDREFVDGETFLYLGKQYRLKVVEGAGLRGGRHATAGRLNSQDRSGPDRVSLVGGWLRVTIGSGASATDRERRVRAALVAWYRRLAQERVGARVAFWAARMGIPAPGFAIREQQQRWASCGPDGSLRFNWRVVQAPARFVDYVVTHELVHLRHRDHTAEFWAALGAVMPDYEKRREGLRRIGGRLVW